MVSPDSPAPVSPSIIVPPDEAGAPCDIAVVAAASLFPGSPDATQFWRHMVLGSDLITDVPTTHWLPEDYYDADPKKPGKVYAKRGAFIPAIDFDPLAFGIPPTILSQTDSTQVLTLWTTGQLLETTEALQRGTVARERVAVILGGNTTDLTTLMAAKIQRPVWENAMRGAGVPADQMADACDRIFASYPDWTEATFPGLLANVIAGRVANRFDFGGTNYTIDAACASSLAAVAAGVQQLQLGLADLVVTGGAETLNTPHMYMCFSKTPALSRTGDCRPFSERADGTMMGEGVGLLALRRLADAERDGDRIYGVIRGIGSGSDGRAKSVYAPRADGQARALARAYAQAGFGPEEVGLIEAHGTGTVAGDAAEVEGLLQLFAPAREQRVGDAAWCALGSLKSQFGHLKTAAGVAGLFKVIMALHHRVLPPTIKVERPGAALAQADLPFYLNTATRPWITPTGTTRKAGVSAFGFGGTNFHFVAEEYAPASAPGAKALKRDRLRTTTKELIPFTADDVAGMAAAVASLADEPAARAWAATAKARQLELRVNAPIRLVVLAADRAEAMRHAEAALARLHKEPQVTMASLAGAWWLGTGEVAGEVAFLFPGQGSQYVGMGGELACEYDAARLVWDGAAALAAQDPTLPSPAEWVFPLPGYTTEDRQAQEAALKLTENAQPALGAVSLAQWHLLRAAGVAPAMVGGHSYGELMALRVAGVLPDDETLLRASVARGRVMAAAAADRAGAMLAAGAGEARVREIVAGLVGVVLANMNSPRQTVLAGTREALGAAETALRAAGVVATPLPVATAFHSEIVAGAVKPFAVALRDLRCVQPGLPVYGNTTAAPYAGTLRAIRAQMAGQLAAPVRFEAQVRAMYAAGGRIFVEVGPGTVLTRLVSDILRDEPHLAVAMDDRQAGSLLGFAAGLGALAAAGVAVDFAPLWREFAEPPADPAPLSKATVKLNGAQFGKPYPLNLPPARPAPTATPVAAKAPPPVPAVSSTPPMQSNPPPLTNGSHPPMPWPAPPPSAAGALVALQHNMLVAFQAHQQALNASYAAYAHASEVALRQLAGAPAGAAHEQFAVAPLPPMPASGYASNGHTNGSAPPIPAPRVMAGPKTNGSHPPMPVAAPAPAPVARSAPVLAPVPTPTPVALAVDTARLLFEVVAEATGYPADMLKPEMQLEADLGIDSIKRVEIFSALSGKVPELGAIEPAQVAKLGTLGEISVFIGQGLGGATTAESAASCAPVDEDRAAVSGVSARWEGRPPPGFSWPGLRAAAPAFFSFASDSAYATSLAARLRMAGLAPRVGEVPPADTRALVLWQGVEGEAPEVSPRHRLRAAMAAVRAAAEGLAQPGAWLVVVMDRARDPWGAGLAGLARTAAREWPELRIKLIDVATAGREPADVAETVARELLTGFDEIEVRLGSDGSRSVPAWEGGAEGESKAYEAPVEGGVWLVSGGARGVTTACLAAVARRGRLRLALLGRTPLEAEPSWATGAADEAGLRKNFLGVEAVNKPSPAVMQAAVRRVVAGREVRAAMAALEAVGAEVRYQAVDVADAAAVARVAADVRAAWGPITGVVHAAGVLADKHIAEKTDEQFDRVAGPKVDGLRALLAATAGDPLRHLVAFTSVAGVFGNAGQVDYAMANAALDAVLAAEAARRGPECRVRALAWGPWDGGMVTEGLRQHFAAQGIALIPRAAGAEYFAEQVAGPATAGVAVLRVCGAGVEAWLPPPPRRGDSVRVEWWLEVGLHPWLGDHRVHGTPVVPIAMVGEFSTRAASLLAPGWRLRRARDLRALNGIRLPDDAPAWFEITVTRDGAAMFNVQIAAPGGGGREHYRVTLELTREPAAECDAPAWTRAELPEWPGDAESFYRRLFHGPRFQGVCALRGRAEDEAAVEIREPAAPLDATPGAWLHACAWIDAAAQAALAHALESHGSLVLPQRMAEQEFFAPFPRDGRVLARLRRRHGDALHERWDIAYLNLATGKLIVIVHDLMLLKVGAFAATEVTAHG